MFKSIFLHSRNQRQVQGLINSVFTALISSAFCLTVVSCTVTTVGGGTADSGGTTSPENATTDTPDGAVDQYKVAALVTYTWQVEYAPNGGSDRHPRLERFSTSSLLNENGQQPHGAVTGPDDQGLWWPALPPRPTVDELEERQKPMDVIGTPRLIKNVKYSFTYQEEGQAKTLPTNYSVYRQVAENYPSQPPLQLTLGIGERSVEKAEPQ